MLFKLIQEKFTSELNRHDHYIKHTINGKEWKWKKVSEEDYEKMAEELSYKPVDYKNIFGYVSKDREGREAYAKYDKEKELFTIYVWVGNETRTITAFRRTWREYQDKMWHSVYGYVDEIPNGK